MHAIDNAPPADGLTEAIGLYRRHGFRATGEAPATGRCDQVHVPDLEPASGGMSA